MILEPRAPFFYCSVLQACIPGFTHYLRGLQQPEHAPLHSSQQEGENGLGAGDTDTVAIRTPLASTKLLVVVSSLEGGNMWF